MGARLCVCACGLGVRGWVCECVRGVCVFVRVVCVCV